MRLISIELQNYRCYQSFKVEFGPGFNVIAGVNGSGKTSLLRAVRDALLSGTRGIPSTTPPPASLADVDAPRVRVRASGPRHRFEPQYPVKLVALADVDGLPITWTAEKTRQFEWVSETGRTLQNVMHEQALQTDVLPVFAFYPAYRQWPAMGVDEISAAMNRESRAAGYGWWWDASADSAAVQQWAVAKNLERLQIAVDQGVASDAITDDELASVNFALRAVIENASGLRYDMVGKTLMIDWLDDRPPTAFQNLSDGQRVSIALVTDIARRMCLLNPQLLERVTQETPGIVLIDELDIHLHPKWQRLLVRGLKAAFPRVQFIAASHSPQILSELRPDEIIVLQSGEAERPQVSYGLDSTRVLELIMETDPRPADVKNALSELFKSIELNKLDEARERLKKLAEDAPGIPELDGAKALIKRKEILGR